MIIILLALFAVLTFISWIMISNRATRFVAGTISGLLLFGTVLLMVANFNNHFGMKKVTTTTTKQVYSAAGSASPAGTLIAAEVGTKSNNYVLVYADKENGSAEQHFVPNQKDIVEAVKKTATYKTADVDKATVTTKTTRWEWSNDLYKSLFGFGGEGGSLYKQTSVVTVPEDTWVVMTAGQAASLKEKMAASQTTAAQAQLATAVKAKVAAYMTSNPNATADQLKAYQQQATAEVAASAMKAMLQ
jgi:hypothetical protein